jgi:hypothetical protein
MGKAGYNIRWIHFDVSDDQLTEVWVYLDALGDCPIGVQGCHHKTFPARMSTDDIMKAEFVPQKFVLWPLEAPPFEYQKE